MEWAYWFLSPSAFGDGENSFYCRTCLEPSFVFFIGEDEEENMKSFSLCANCCKKVLGVKDGD